MKKIIDKLINHSIKGVDVYRYKNATWLIFSDEKRWVVELTDNGTLWYNYNFFSDIFKYVSLECGGESNDYIIGWANDFFYKDCAHRSIAYPMDKGRNETPKVLEGGIKKVEHHGKNHGDEFEWNTRVVIGKGVKEVYDSSATHRQMRAQNLMGRIVKDVKPHCVIVPVVKGMDRFYYDPGCGANNIGITHIIEEGVKEVKPNVVFHGIDKSSMSYVPCNGNTTDINVIVNNGIKNIYPDQNSGDYDWSDEFDANKVVGGGVKV